MTPASQAKPEILDVLTSGLSATSLLTTTAALLAFLIGMLTLVGRERNSPYLINTVLAIFLSCLAGAAMDLLSIGLHGTAGKILLLGGFALLLISFVMSFLRTYVIYLRLHHFVDHISPKNFPIVLGVRRYFRKRSNKSIYEYDPLKFPAQVEEKLGDLYTRLNAKFSNSEDVRAICIKAQYQQQSTDILVEMAIICLQHGVSVQFLTASHHPIHFVNALSRRAAASHLDFRALAGKNLVVIDAYQPHYAFLDSIYLKRTAELERMGVTCLVAKMSYAGIHTAASQAFNELKRRTGGTIRGPAMVIYEDPLALADLESSEQYRVFVRHVLPYERLWGSMFTVVVETAPAEADWRLLQAYADVAIELPPRAPKSDEAGLGYGPDGQP